MTHSAHLIPSRLKLVVVSDVHLNDHDYDTDEFTENPRRKIFREFLTRLNHEAKSNHQETTLLLNGDVFDITGSWFSSVLPWEHTDEVVEPVLCQTIERIINNNQSIIHELHAFLRHKHNHLHFVIGNHDGMLAHSAAAQQQIKQRICLDDSGILVESLAEKIHFSHSFELLELGFYAEHGHRFDPFNSIPSAFQATQRHAFGDYINILLINRFVEMVSQKLDQAGYSSELIESVRQELRDIEYLRPLSLVPLWVQTIANHYQSHPETMQKLFTGRWHETADSIIRSVLAEILDANTTRPLLEQLHFPRQFMTTLLNWFVHLPAALPIVTFAITSLVKRTHSNKYQLNTARKLVAEKGYRFIAFGHTHHPAVIPMNESAYYFNTGSWKPVMNLYKPDGSKQNELDYLTPNVQFNKIGNSGILVLEKDRQEPNSVTRFYLQTVQSSFL